MFALGSAVSSPNGVRGEAPAAVDFGAFWTSQNACGNNNYCLAPKQVRIVAGIVTQLWGGRVPPVPNGLTPLLSRLVYTVQLDQVSQDIIVSRLLYALPAWSEFLTVDLINRTQSTLNDYIAMAILLRHFPSTISSILDRLTYFVMLKSNRYLYINCCLAMFSTLTACAHEHMTVFYRHVSAIYINSLLSLSHSLILYSTEMMSLCHPAMF